MVEQLMRFSLLIYWCSRGGAHVFKQLCRQQIYSAEVLVVSKANLKRLSRHTSEN